MNSAQLFGSALLVKARAFLARGFSDKAVFPILAPGNYGQMLLPTRLPEETRARN
jgi:hypothetical protein